MRFYLTTVSRINRGGESVTSTDGFFDTENEEILAVAKAMGATFDEPNHEKAQEKTETVFTPKKGRKPNAQI